MVMTIRTLMSLQLFIKNSNKITTLTSRKRKRKDKYCKCGLGLPSPLR